MIPILIIKLIASQVKNQCDEKKGADSSRKSMHSRYANKLSDRVYKTREIDLWYRHRNRKWVVIERFVFDRREVSEGYKVNTNQDPAICDTALVGHGRSTDASQSKALPWAR